MVCIFVYQTHYIQETKKLVIKKLHPELLYSIVGFLLIVFSFLSSESIDIAIHDTYLIIAVWHLFIGLAFIFLMFAGITWLFRKVNKPLIKSLSFVHFFITIFAIGTLAVLVILSSTTEPTRYYDYSVYNGFLPTSDLPDYTSWMVVTISIGLLTQLLLLFNIVISLTSQKNRI